MKWQDYVLMICSFMFTVALVPSLLGPEKPPFRTAVLTSALLLVNTVMFFTLDLWLTGLSTLFNFFAWTALAVQIKRIRHRANLHFIAGE